MTDPSPVYSVILRSGLPEREVEFFTRFCSHLASDEGGAPLLHFHCTQVDVSHHSYIEMETFRPPEKELWTVRVPHHYVLMIDGSAQRPSMGF